jgi:hypothetical protein
MIKDGLLVAVFPVPNGGGIPVEPQDLADALRAELALLE